MDSLLEGSEVGHDRFATGLGRSRGHTSRVGRDGGSGGTAGVSWEVIQQHFHTTGRGTGEEGT